ncbi:hypothetical protein CPB83DRAFT_859533 [Crepidotus variabilis]|uniref:Uncharacterized protein n=1 Tax=Crepidotus variabilis TaxID=179855 RepID=A0A9P6JLL4_9AGAR|nr:hypothetical protein CPB83DRAFT_859533 [Crepidotus variabilis]
MQTVKTRSVRRAEEAAAAVQQPLATINHNVQGLEPPALRSASNTPISDPAESSGENSFSSSSGTSAETAFSEIDRCKREPTEEEKARYAEMFDPYSYTSLFGGPLTPNNSPPPIEIPLPTDFDFAFGLEGDFIRPGVEEERGLLFKGSSAKPTSMIQRGLFSAGSQWSFGSEDKLQKSKEWELSREVRKPLDIFAEYMKQLEEDKRAKSLLQAHYDDDDDMEIDDGLAMDIDGIAPKEIGSDSSSDQVPQLGPEGTIICDQEEEEQRYKQYQGGEGVYPQEWVRRRKNKKRAYATEIIE